jgi:dynein heavy chain
VKVLSYDDATNRFLVKQVDSGMQKYVERLSLLFDDEDKNMFKDRVQQSKHYQKRAEDEMRFQNYAEKVPDDKVSTLSKTWTNRIISKALAKRRKTKDEDLNYVDVFTKKIMKTVEAEYVREMKKCFVLGEMLDKNNREKFQKLKIDIRKDKPVVPYYGTIGVLPSLKYWDQNQRNLRNNLLMTNDEVAYCLQEFAKKSAEKIFTHMFNYNISKSNLPMTKERFLNFQTDFHQDSCKTLNNLWRESQITTISSISGLTSSFNKDDYRENKKKFEPMFRFIRRMDLFFRSNVIALTEYNLQKYVEFVRQFVMPENIDDNSEIWAVSKKPLLLLTIMTKDKGDTAEEPVKKERERKPTDEEAIFFSPKEDEIIEAIKSPINQLMDSVNRIYTLESNIFRTLGIFPEKPIFPVSADTPMFKKALEEVTDLLNRALKEPLRILKEFRKNAYLLKKSADDLVRQYLEKKDTSAATEDGKEGKPKGVKKKGVDELDTYIQSVENSIRAIQDICTNEKNTIFFMLQTGASKKVLIDKANEIRSALLSRVGKNNNQDINKIQQGFEDLSNRLKEVPQDEVMYSNLIKVLEDPNVGHEKIIESLEQDIDELGKYFDLLIKYSRDSGNFKKSYFAYWALKKFPQLVKNDARDAKVASMKYFDKFQKQVNEFKLNTARAISDLEQKFEEWKHMKYEEWINKESDQLTYDNTIDKANEDFNSLITREQLLGQEATKFENLKALEEAYAPFKELRQHSNNLNANISTYDSSALMKLRYKEVAQTIDGITKKVTSLCKKFEGMDDAPEAALICQQILNTISQFRGRMPIIKSLTKDAILKKPNYWVEIVKATELNLTGQKISQQTITLNDLVNNFDIMKHIDIIEEICNRAEKEYSLEQKYAEEVTEVLKKQKLETKDHKNTGTQIIVGVDDIMQLLDEKLTLLVVMKQNPNVKPIKGEVEKTEKKLRGYQDMFDEWVKCQRDWIYLEPIFNSDEIAKELPEAYKNFRDVDEKWREIMKLIKQDDVIFERSDWESFLQNLKSNNRLLDKIQKSLNTYLGSKREEFPRFYFLSDEELLEILSRAKDPTLVTKYMKKCFEAIEYIDFSPNLEVINMKSAEKECVDFLRPVITNSGDRKGRVEKWLNDVEAMMRETLIKVSINCSNDTTERTKWVFKWPGQVILAVNNVRWTAGVEDAIRQNTMKEFSAKLIKEREEIVDLVKGELTPLQRTTLGALIVIDQHAIYVVDMLIQNKIDMVEDFDWISQLRYYMHAKDKEKIKVQMITSTLSYQYEYLGNSDRLVITPLTDRCYRTLMGAFQYNYGGAPEGPAGTGKTETVKDLAKAIAVQCVVFNCSDQINYVAMSKFFKGLSQCGSWCCFDEFNRIHPEVLSVIAEQVRTIQIAIKEGRTRFTFEGVECRLMPSAFTCITMNPGYAGRSELPDNLKALFRPCAMMVPDYSLISEISLFSYGYQTATALAKKIVASLRLSSEQLSSQKHYDFGMRALKAILVAAGNLKKKNHYEDEDKLCIRALFDVNLPKFTQNDIPLFNSITSDLFRDTKPPMTDYTLLIQKITELCEVKNVMAEPVILKKCIETYETLLVRHGLMLVGQTCSGKTVVFNLLRDALTALNGTKDYIRTVDYWLNPKAVDSFQLFGKLDANTKLWTDGVLPQIMRFCENDVENPERKWIVFDGPVDAVWIENMNTVLDDNKILCLTNGQKIKVTPQMNMMFEVEDLDNASPATVSRCGMVYLEPRQLGWKPLVFAYTKYKLPKPLHPMRAFLEMTLIWMLTPVLVFVRKNSKLPFLVDNMQMTTSVLKIFDSLCNLVGFKNPEYNGPNKEGKEGENLINNFCVFSVVWGVGGVIEDSRNDFNKFLLGVLTFEKVAEKYGLDLEDDNWEPRGLSMNFGEGAVNLYELTFDINSNLWTQWMKTVQKWVPPKPETPFNELIVPTSDTIRNSYLINLLIGNNSHVLLTGPTGTAKTISSQNEINTNYKTKDIGSLQMVFSGQTSANQVQLMIEAKMTTRYKKGHFCPEDGKLKMVVFIDDVNMPIKEEYGAQPPIELLRMWADHGFWYDLQDREKKHLLNMQLLCTMGPPSTGRNMVSRRFLRHFYILFTETFDEKSLNTIFSSILDWYFLGMKGKLPASIVGLKEQVIEASTQVYMKVCRQLLPTPKKSHYIYNLRDVSRVIQGITKATLRSYSDPNDLIKLWAHECMRVFSDRLVDKNDLNLFNDQILKPVMNEVFKKPWTSVVKLEPLLFGHFIPTKYPDGDTTKPAYPDVYCELVNRENLQKYSEKFLKDYNDSGGGSSEGEKDKLNLVLFMTAIEHLVRIVRILSTPFGHALLVGVGGSGKKSLAKLATFIVDYDRFQIEVNKEYDYKKNWPEDLQKLLRKCGVDNRPTTFLFIDTQIFKEAVLEDLSSILNQGEVPNLFGAEEKANITTNITDNFPQESEGMSTNQKFEFFIKNCKKNLHLCLCFSPVGESFRKRLRTFPSLINCTTIDWFLPWPNEALKGVALALLKDSTTNLPQEQLEKVSDIFVLMQERVVNLSKRYLEELKKYFYVTPTSYLELVNCFKTMLTKRIDQSLQDQNKYKVGLEKIANADKEVSIKRAELEELKPKLQESSEETDRIIINVQKGQIEADKTRAICEKEETECNRIKDAANKLKAECQIEVNKAEVILAQAAASLTKIKVADIDELKGMKAPTEAVKLLFQCLCIMLDAPVKMIKDPNNPYGKIPDYLTAIRTDVMANSGNLIKTLTNYKDDTIIMRDINQGMIDKVTKIAKQNDQVYTEKNLQKSSVAAAALYHWIESMVNVYNTLLDVNPKRQSLKQAQEEAAAAEAALKEKNAALQAVVDNINELKKKQKEAEERKTQLKADVDKCKRQLGAAEELTKGFASEKESWKERKEILEANFPNILGECLVASGVIAYLGAFPMEYRLSTISQWIKFIQEKEIKINSDFSLREVCSDDFTISNWVDKYKLPNDNISIENAIIIKESSRYPLIIDPQLQANRWIIELYASKCLKTLKPNQINPKSTPTLIGQYITEGFPLLVEGVEEYIDPMFESLFNQQKELDGKETVIKFLDKFLVLHPGFKFFVTTKLANPHYPPEICAKVTLINFTVTPEGLEDQLKNIVVGIEDQKLEQKRQAAIKRSSDLKSKQISNEKEILKLLSEQVGNILDDENLISKLNESKKDSLEAKKELENIQRNNKKYEDACHFFKEVGFRISNIFFCVMDLAAVEPMYQFSLEWFIEQYKAAINTGAKVKETRVNDIISIFTDLLFIKVCRSLFEKDKLLFAFLLYLKKLICDKVTTNLEIRTLLLTLSPREAKEPNPCPEWLSNKQWNIIYDLSVNYSEFHNLHEDFKKNTAEWAAIYQNEQPQSCRYPDRWSKVTAIQRLIILKVLRPDKIVQAIQNEISNNMGKQFVEFEAFSLDSIFKDSRSNTPIVFILSPGSDPLAEIIKLSRKPGMGASVQALSLGQGQEKAAETAISNAKKNGEWVVLQNCHLAPGFLSVIERSLDPIAAAASGNSNSGGAAVENDRYRLWLTSMPTNKFPVTILQNGVKLTNEPPRGIKSSMQKTFMSYDNKMLDDLKNEKNLPAWKKLVFGLSFFHAVILERRKFGALGWNIPYQFSQMDMNISMSQLKTFLENYQEVEWKALHYLIAEANYGGRVTDPMDRRLIRVILKTYFCDEILSEGYKFSESGIYYAPPTGSQESYLEYIRNVLPLNDEPEVFGMHTNANITSGLNDTNELLTKVLNLQPQIAEGGASSTDNLIKSKCREIIETLPKPFDLEEAAKKFPVRYEESMNTVLQQELIRFNNLRNTIDKTLVQLEKAIEGTIIMSSELEEIYNKIYIYQVPDAWHKQSYPSLKPLSSWYEDFKKRLAFMDSWLKNGQPTSFWISGFFFTQSFLTGTLQNYARKMKKEIDTIIFDFKVLKTFNPKDITEKPEFGSYVYGLYLEAANWSIEREHLEESLPKVLFNEVPLIWLIPMQISSNHPPANRRDYTCPVYKTSKRAGTLSTTGHSTNFVMSMELPMSKKHTQEHWIKRGVALLCQLDD